jgi:hypothetical protein
MGASGLLAQIGSRRWLAIPSSFRGASWFNLQTKVMLSIDMLFEPANFASQALPKRSD